MGLNKRLIGGAAAGGAVPTNTDNFDIVTYTGTNSSFNVGNGLDASVTINSGTANYALGSTSYGNNSGKHYFEVEYISANGASNTLMVGIINTAYVESWTNAQTKMYYAGNGNKYTGGTGTSYGATYAPGDVIGVAYDGTARTVTFYKNNVSQGTAFTGLITNFPSYKPAIGTGLYSETAQFRFTSSEFTYTPPSGYSEWGSATVSAHSGTVNSAQAAQPLDFQPDLIWFKNRTGTNAHALVDSVRSRSKYVFSNLTNAEPSASASGQDLISFNSNGFTVGTVNNAGSTNVSGGSIVAWCFKGGGTAVSNTDGSITSQVSANQDAGFSIVEYTGNGGNATIGHGLSQQAELVITKMTVQNSGSSSTSQWMIYHKDLAGNTSGDNPFNLYFGTNAELDLTAFGGYDDFTSTVFPVTRQSTSTAHNNNNTSDYIAYCFHSVDGYQKIGSYTGNASSLNTISVGFAPRFVMFKRTDSTGGWRMFDSTRGTDKSIQAQDNGAEYDDTQNYVDFTSDGFEFNRTVTQANPDLNSTGGTYIYLAIA